MKAILSRAALVLLSASAMTVLSGGLPLVAQESARTRGDINAKKIANRTVDPTRRVPNYFGQLGLSEAQKESIYKIQAKHQPTIDALERQLEDLRARSLKECESVLTDAQKRMLAERRAHAAEARAKRSSGANAEAKPKG
jgi:hypothetical protein